MAEPGGFRLTVAAGASEPELGSSDRSGPRGIPMETENLLPLPRPSTVFSQNCGKGITHLLEIHISIEQARLFLN